MKDQYVREPVQTQQKKTHSQKSQFTGKNNGNNIPATKNSLKKSDSTEKTNNQQK